MRKNSITNFTKLTVVCFMSLLLAGCPVGLEYPIDETDRNLVDNALVGTWVAEDQDADILKMVIEKPSDKMLLVKVIDRGEGYMSEASAYYAGITTLKNHRIAYARPIDAGGDSKFYHYHFTLEGNSLVISDMSLLVGGKDAVTSTTALRDEVIASMGKEEWLSSSFKYKRE
jgi:hypothetical protein